MKVTLKFLSLFLILGSLHLACDDDDFVDPGKVEYVIRNASDENFGFKVRLVSGGKGNLINESTVIKPEEEITMVRSQKDLAPYLVIEAIEIWDAEFKTKHKELALDDCSKTNVRYMWIVESL